jgi:hypothetical protein
VVGSALVQRIAEAQERGADPVEIVLGDVRALADGVRGARA